MPDYVAFSVKAHVSRVFGYERRTKGRKRGRLLFTGDGNGVNAELFSSDMRIRLADFKLTSYGRKRIDDVKLLVIIEWFFEYLERPTKVLFYSSQRAEPWPLLANDALRFRALPIVLNRFGNITFLGRKRRRKVK